MFTEYRIAVIDFDVSSSPREIPKFEADVSEHLQRGWKLHGSLCVTCYEGSYCFFQALAK
jgi:hypothetical protein